MLYTRRIDKTYRPLELVYSIETLNSVPTIQQYDSDANEWIPDYGIVPLVLQPHVFLYDKDGVLEDGEVTNRITNVQWTEIVPPGVAGQDQVITATQANNERGYPDYALEVSGEYAGRLTIRKRYNANTQWTLRFECDFVDPRNSSVMHIVMDKVISCTNATATPPTIDIDCPETFVFNPWRDANSLTINARLSRGADTLTTGVTYYFEKKRANGAWTAIGNTTAYAKAQFEDLGFSISGGAFTQDLSLMGDRLDMRVRATYPSKQTLADDSPTKYFTLIRRLPDFEVDYGGVPEDIETFVKTVYPRLVITDHDGVVAHPCSNVADVERGTAQNVSIGEIEAIWYTAAGVASGNPTLAIAGYGEEPAIPTNKINNYGMQLAVEIVDRGARGAIVDSENDYIVDSEGDIIIDR